MPTLEFRRVDKHIVVPSPDTSVTVQEIYDQSQEWLSDQENLRETVFVEAAGKFDLGGGEFTAVSLRLLNDWQLKFEDRVSPTVCLVLGGNLIASNTFGNNPVANSTNVFPQIRQSTAPAGIATGGLVTTLQEVRDAMQLAATGITQTGSVDGKLDNLASNPASLNPQEVRDAMLLAPSPTLGDPEVGSVDDKLDEIALNPASLNPQEVRDALLLAPSPTLGDPEVGSVDDQLATLQGSVDNINIDPTAINAHTTAEADRVIGAVDTQTTALIAEINNSGLSPEAKQELIDALCQCVENIQIIAYKERVVMGPCQTGENTTAQQQPLPQQQVPVVPQALPRKLKQVPKMIPRKPMDEQ